MHGRLGGQIFWFWVSFNILLKLLLFEPSLASERAVHVREGLKKRLFFMTVAIKGEGGRDQECH